MSISALFIIVYLMSWNHLPKQAKQIRTERSVKAPLTFSPHWKCANTWSHQTWSWKKTHNIWWTFCQESWPFSLSCYLFVFFFPPPPPLQPFYQLLSCWFFIGPCLLFAQGNRRRGTEVQTKLLTSVCWGQINCVKVCVAKCVSTLSWFFFIFFLCSACHRGLVSCATRSFLSFRPLTGEQKYVWQTILLRWSKSAAGSASM